MPRLRRRIARQPLHQVTIGEQVQVDQTSITGVFTGVNFDLGHAPPAPANKFTADRHLIPAYYLTSIGAPVGFQAGGGSFVVNQVNILVRQKNSWVDSGSGNLPSE